MSMGNSNIYSNGSSYHEPSLVVFKIDAYYIYYRLLTVLREQNKTDGASLYYLTRIVRARKTTIAIRIDSYKVPDREALMHASRLS